MTLKRTCSLGCLAMLMAACGGSGSETPPPVEPTSPRAGEEPPEPPKSDEPKADDQDETAPAESDSEEPAPAEEEAD